MLNHTRKIKEIYEDIQRKLYYMIPEKWDKLYLYSAVIDMPNGEKKGELYFYYIPKGILKKKPVNVYEIPNKFNLDENDYMKLVSILFSKIKLLREEFRKSETGTLWSNITISIENTKFKVDYNYEDLTNCEFNSYERHIIWRYEYLGIGEEQINKKDKEILKRYLLGPKTIRRKETYETGIYINDIENKIAYNTDEANGEREIKKTENISHNGISAYINNNYIVKNIAESKNVEQENKEKNELDTINKKTKRKNQLLLSEEQIRKYEEQHRRKNNNSI